MLKANYILLDSAKMAGEINYARELNPEHTCLYEGDSEKFLSTVAPWLFEFESGSEFADWISKHSHRNNWGILIRSEEEPIKIYKHLRKFLVVRTEEGKELYFRFYDPRVLRVFLPTCDKEQLREFFGPITAFIAEDENGLLVEYALSQEQLVYSETGEEMKAFTKGDETMRVSESQIPESNHSPVENEVEFEKEFAPKSNPAPAPKPRKPRSSNWDFGY